MTPRTLLAATALAAGLVAPVSVVAPADALSCVGPERVLDDAEVVYTGKVVDTRDSRVLVEVEEVWRGSPVEAQVWLTVELEVWTEWAGPDGRIPDGFATTSTWLFAPGEKQTIGPCTSWAMDGSLREYVDEHRPAQPEAPVAVSPEPVAGEAAAAAEGVGTEPVREQGGPTGWPLAGGLAGLLAAIGAAVVLLGRRRARR